MLFRSLLDEPTDGLDPEGIRWVRTLMRDLAADGRTVLVSSHLLSEMADTADRLLVIGRGRLLAATTVADFRARGTGGGVRVRSPQLAQLRTALTDGGHTVVDDGPDALLGMDLLRLGLERASSAADAVSTIVDLLEAHGQGGSCSHEHPRFRYDNSFLVADPDGAIVLETAGRSWATEEVRGPGRAISNGLTIPAFAKAHADPVHSQVTACAVRRARTEPAAAAARKLSGIGSSM